MNETCPDCGSQTPIGHDCPVEFERTWPERRRAMEEWIARAATSPECRPRVATGLNVSEGAEDGSERPMSEARTLYLAAEDLGEKHGFYDGDCPDWVLDLCDERGIGYPDDWHGVLRGLVRDFLLPAIPEDRRPEVYDMQTIHNPIRTDAYRDTPAPDVSVEVSADEVLRRLVAPA